MLLEYCGADALHCASRSGMRLFVARTENIPNLLRIGLEFLAPCLNRLNPFDQIIRHGRFAFDAADAGGAATVVRPGDRLGRRK